MNTPPNPGIPEILLLVAAKLGYAVTVGARGTGPELGAFIDANGERPLILAAGDGPFAAGGCGWAFDAPGCIPFVFTRETYNVLHFGQLGAVDGTILWESRIYRIQATWDGFRPVAKAVVVSR